MLQATHNRPASLSSPHCYGEITVYGTQDAQYLTPHTAHTTLAPGAAGEPRVGHGVALWEWECPACTGPAAGPARRKRLGGARLYQEGFPAVIQKAQLNWQCAHLLLNQ